MHRVFDAPQDPGQFQQHIVAEASYVQQAAHYAKQFIGRAALSLGLAAGLLAGEAVLIDPPAAVADTGGYPDWEAPCVANNNGVTQGSGNWCSGYQWGYYVRNAQGQIVGNTQNSSRGFGYRNCTDWAAYRAQQLTGVSVPYGAAMGNATDWDNNATTYGYTVDNTAEPGDIAVWDATPTNSFGHVAAVESVNADGTVNVSEYNQQGNGNYGTRSSQVANHYIDLNGTGKGINGEILAGGSGGGADVARPAAIAFNNALNVFIRGGDGNIYAQYWNGNTWSGYTNIGGGMASDPSLIVHNGALSVFARGNDGQIYTKSNNGSGWNGWVSLGTTTMRGTPRVIQYGSEVDVFALGADNHPYKNTWQSGTGWGGWSSLGNYMDSSPAPVVNGSDLSVVMRGGDNQVYVDTWNGSSWSGFASLGGVVSGNPDAIQYSGQTDVVVNTPTVNRIYMDTKSGSTWGGWADHGGQYHGDVDAMQFNTDLEFFVRGTDGHIWTRWWSPNSQAWGGWNNLGGNIVGDPTAIQYSTELDVFAVGSDGKTYKNTWLPNVGWGGFTALPG